MNSEDYSWRWVTEDSLLSTGPCELTYAYLVVSAASTDTHLHNGVDTNGGKIATLETAAITGHPFKPKEPIYCHHGLYLDVGTNVTGVFVQWRELPRGKEEPAAAHPSG